MSEQFALISKLLKELFGTVATSSELMERIAGRR